MANSLTILRGALRHRGCITINPEVIPKYTFSGALFLILDCHSLLRGAHPKGREAGNPSTARPIEGGH